MRHSLIQKKQKTHVLIPLFWAAKPPIPNRFLTSFFNAHLLTIKETFIKNFANDATFRTGIISDPTLIDIWLNVKRLRTYSNDITFLTALKLLSSNEELKKHIFKGNFVVDITNLSKAIFNISGVHHQAAFTSCTVPYQNFDVRLKTILKEDLSQPLPNRRYQCKIEVFHTDWVRVTPKTAMGWKTADTKTFYPDAWSPSDVLEEMALAFKNKVVYSTDPNEPTVVTYIGACSVGFNLAIVERNNIIQTIYPTSFL